MLSLFTEVEVGSLKEGPWLAPQGFVVYVPCLSSWDLWPFPRVDCTGTGKFTGVWKLLGYEV